MPKRIDLPVALATAAGLLITAPALAVPPRLVEDLVPPQSSNPSNLVVVDDSLYFMLADNRLIRLEPGSLFEDVIDGFVTELEASDGFVWYVEDIIGPALKVHAPGGGFPVEVAEFDDVAELTDVGGKLFFAASDGVDGSELWTSTGPTGVTGLVLDANPTGDAAPEQMTKAGSGVAYTADDGTNGRELWMSDGTAGGTFMVADLTPGPDGTSIGELAHENGLVFFAADVAPDGREPWVSDGTILGTVPLLDLNPAGDSNPADFTAFGSLVFFTADDGVNGRELWVNDGTVGGTTLFADLNPGPGSSLPSEFVVDGGFLYFRATNGTDGVEPWRTDGTVGGTVQIADVKPGPGSSDPTQFTAFVGGIGFAADDGSSGIELWRTDGSESGTVRVSDIQAGAGSSSPGWLVEIDSGALAFSADDGLIGRELWVSDGTGPGTELRQEFAFQSSLPELLIEYAGEVYLRAYTEDLGEELYATDGTSIRLVKDVVPGPWSGFNVGEIIEYDGLLYFRGDNDLWFSDGTDAGTQPLGTFLDNPSQFLVADGKLFFAASDPTVGNEIRCYDGTTMTLVADINPGPDDSDPSRFTLYDGEIYFAADNGVNGVELWKTNGTPLGTSLVADINPTGDSVPISLTVVGDLLYFAADDGIHGEELWVTSGTGGSTFLVEDLNPGPDGGNLVSMVAFGDVLLFRGTDDVVGEELFRAGPAGVQLVKDVNPVAGSSVIFGIEYDGVVHFAATDDTGREPWVTDGTTAGTVKLANPDGATNPIGYLVHDNRVVFTGDVDMPSGETRGAVCTASDGEVDVIWRPADIAFPYSAISSGPTLLVPMVDDVFGGELFAFDSIVSTPEWEPTPRPPVTIRAVPSPMRNASSIHFTVPDLGPDLGPVVVQIFDVAGRRVRSLLRDRLDAGPHAVTWDGRDEAGRRVAAGVYVVRAQGGAWSTTTKVVVATGR